MHIRLFFFELFLMISAVSSAQPVSGFLRQGDAAYASFNNALAIDYYRRAVEQDPFHFTALTRLVRVQNDEGRLALRRSDSSEVFYRRALATAETLVARYPGRAESWFLLALCHGSLVPFKGIQDKINIGRDVEENLRRSLSIDSTYAMSYVLLGIYYRSASQLSWMERTIVNTLLGKHIIGTLEDSERALRTAIRLEPRSPYPYFELASTLRALGRREEAIDLLRTVVALPYRGARERMQVEDAQRRLDRWQEPAPATSGP